MKEPYPALRKLAEEAKRRPKEEPLADSASGAETVGQLKKRLAFLPYVSSIRKPAKQPLRPEDAAIRIKSAMLSWACELVNKRVPVAQMSAIHRESFQLNFERALPLFMADFAERSESRLAGHFFRKLERPYLSPDDLEFIRQALSGYFEAIFSKAPIARLPAMTLTVLDVRTAGRYVRLYDSPQTPAAVLMVLLRLIDELGHDAVRKCSHCGRFFVSKGRKQFCARRCVEAAKLKRYKASPTKAADYNERHALTMWRKSCREANKGRQPSGKTIQVWLRRYRSKRRKRGLPVSKRPMSEVV